LDVHRRPGKNALVFILVTMAIDSIGFGLITPVLPALLKELLGASAAEAAPWGGFLAFTYAAMNFLCGPILGNLSDRFGRRPVLLVSLATLGIDYLLMGFAHSIWLLVLGRVLSGISGATLATAKAYMADVTEPSERAQAFGLIGAAFGIGFIFGPAIGGILGDIDSRAPFFAAAALAGVNVIYGWLILPESLAPENRREFVFAKANPLGTFAHLAKVPSVRILLIAVLLFNFAHCVYPSTWSFHADARYAWDTKMIGWSLMAIGIGFTLVQGGLIRFVIQALGPAKTAVLGLACNVVAFVGYAFASEAWMIYLWIPVSALGAVGGPAVNALMSARVPANAQGALQGALSSVQALANMFGPIVMTQVFSYFVTGSEYVQWYGAAFLFAAILTLLSLIPFRLGVRAGKEATWAS
jgi:DHA1 family tetracycline resistance protein-like MFS transporter